jgi:phosphopantetheine--protein transferase-like protein
MTRSVVVYLDGGSRGNPGPAGYGVRIEDEEGRVVDEFNGTIEKATNNAAEYRALIAALEYLAAHGHRDAVVRSDSELLTRQMRGEYRVRQPELALLHGRAGDLAGQLAQVRFEHVPRERNRDADALANAAMDGRVVRGKAPPPALSAPPAGAEPPLAALAGPGDRVIGIGIDIEEVARVEELATRYGDRFIGRIFTDEEAGYCRRRRTPAQHFAARFSAKEAAMKALGTGRARGVLWRDVEVVRDGGPPQLRLHGGARRRFEALGATRSLLSMTHSRQLAIAQVVLVAH